MEVEQSLSLPTPRPLKRRSALVAESLIKDAMKKVVHATIESANVDGRPARKRARIEGELQKRPLAKSRNKETSVLQDGIILKSDSDRMESEMDNATQDRPPSRQLAGPVDTVHASGTSSSPGQHEILVSRKTSFAVYMKRCKKMVLAEGAQKLTFQATGAAITRAMEIVLVLCDELGGPAQWDLSLYTGTATLVDDVVTEACTDGQRATQTRLNSYVKIILTQITKAERERTKRTKRNLKRRAKAARKKGALSKEVDLDPIAEPS